MSKHLGFSWQGVLVGLALLSGSVGSARAEFWDDIADFFSGNAPEVPTTLYCDSYALQATVYVDRARESACPLTGPRYGTDGKAHYFWCMGVTPETSRGESDAREKEVTECRNLSTQTYCSTYGDRAAKDARDNKLYHCGFTGPRWGEGSEGHRAYCISEKIAQSLRGEVSNWPSAEYSARLEAIERCKAKYSEKKIQFCNLYATEAVESLNKYKEMKCIGSSWPSDYDTHFSWCIGLSKGVGKIASKASIERVNAETQKHRDALNACITRNELMTRAKESPTNKLYSGPNRRSLEEFSKVAPPGSAPAKPNPASNAKPGTGGIYLSKPGNSNSAMDRLSGSGEVSVGGGGGGGINTSKPGAPKPSGGINTAKPVASPSGGGGGGIYLSKPGAPPSGGGGGGIYLSKPGGSSSGGSR